MMLVVRLLFVAVFVGTTNRAVFAGRCTAGFAEPFPPYFKSLRSIATTEPTATPKNVLVPPAAATTTRYNIHCARHDASLLSPLHAAPMGRNGRKAPCSFSPLFTPSTATSLTAAADGGDDDEAAVAEPPVEFLVGLFGSWAHIPMRLFFPQLKQLSYYWLGAFMVAASYMRLQKDKLEDVLMTIVPPPLPPRLTSYVSGVIEFVLGIMIFTGHPLASRGTLALILAVTPSHFYVAFSEKGKKDCKMTPAMAWARVAMQGPIIAWAQWFV